MHDGLVKSFVPMDESDPLYVVAIVVDNTPIGGYPHPCLSVKEGIRFNSAYCNSIVQWLALRPLLCINTGL